MPPRCLSARIASSSSRTYYFAMHAFPSSQSCLRTVVSPQARTAKGRRTCYILVLWCHILRDHIYLRRLLRHTSAMYFAYQGRLDASFNLGLRVLQDSDARCLTDTLDFKVLFAYGRNHDTLKGPRRFCAPLGQERQNDFLVETNKRQNPRNSPSTLFFPRAMSTWPGASVTFF